MFAETLALAGPLAALLIAWGVATLLQAEAGEDDPHDAAHGDWPHVPRGGR